MNLQIAVLLGQDGITNGAVYALLALSIVLVFTVTRVLLIPLGEYVAYGALTLAALQAGQRSAVVWLLVGLCAACAVLDLVQRWRDPAARLGWAFAAKLLYPLPVLAVLYGLAPADLPQAAQIALTLALLVPLGPLLYRLVYQPIADAPALVLLIVSIALHVSMMAVGLLVFGAEGARAAPMVDAMLEFGSVRLKAQTLAVIAASLLLIVALALFFGRSLYGKALRAAAMNRTGARLMGISPVFAGKATFLLASFIGTLSGVLIAPLTTIYFDSGFLISLKGFVGAIIGGLVSYPVAAAGAVLVGLIEAYSAFWASAYKEIIVFTLIIPVLLWRSLTSHHVEEDD
ncbi:MAG: branched-chain amino acid ABC transporter permease [Rubrivivax sp.]